jgi:hypothetical protein
MRGDDYAAKTANKPIEMLLKHRHGGHDARLTAGRECVKVHVGRDEGGDKFGVRSRSRTTAADGIGHEVNLRTYERRA